MRHRNRTRPSLTIGVDLGDKYAFTCTLDRDGEVVSRERLRMTIPDFREYFSGLRRCRVVIEAGSQSGWVSRELKRSGHQVIVANPRKVQLIYRSHNKSDKVDAERLARIGRLDPRLLYPVQHRGEDAQIDLALLRSRDALVKMRTLLINSVRSQVKVFGDRLPTCDSRYFHKKVTGKIPARLQVALEPLVSQIADLTEDITGYDRKIEELSATKYPETARLRQVSGVGSLVALAYILTLEDHRRFSRSRSVGPFLGLAPKRSDSGSHEPQLRISKAGDRHLRQLLVNAAHCALRSNARESDLKAHGEAIAKRGGKNAKKRAVVAVARKLAVLLHRLWISGEEYEPLRQRERVA